MAAIVSPWSKAGAWALDSEENEDELLQQGEVDATAAAAAADSASSTDFPSLSAAAATKQKKKKGQTLSLAGFASYGSAQSKPASEPSKGLTPEDLLILPTGPRQRTAEELDRSRLGGGFKSYGSGRYGEERERRDKGGEKGWFRDSSREPIPSRADEIDDWGASKKSSLGGGFERRERGGGGGGGGGFFGSHSKADESDNWASNKVVPPGTEPPRRYGGVGGGDFGRERRGFRGGFEGVDGGSGADSDRWGRRREDDGLGNSMNSGSSGRPKLVLQPRTLPVNEEVQSGGSKPKGASPFGDARPREEVLKEKGQDWKEIDEKLESMKIKEVKKGERDHIGEGSFGKRESFGRVSEDRTERNWRKNDAVNEDAPSPSVEETENGPEETEEVDN